MTEQSETTTPSETDAEAALRGVEFVTAMLKAGQVDPLKFIASEYVEEHMPKTEQEAFAIKRDLESLAWVVELTGQLYSLVGRERFVPKAPLPENVS